MPSGATLTAGGTAATSRGDERQAVMPVVPFVRASQQHREAAFDTQRVMTAADQDLGVFDVPAYGYARALILHVQLTGGSGTSVTLTEDGPWNVLKNIAFQEPNGATILQFNSGYELYLANKYGGYRGFDDPKAGPRYSVTVGTSALAEFIIRIPLELLERDGLGSLPNQNSAASFKLRLTLASIATIFGGTVSGAPTARVRGYLEAWDQPETATNGMTNQTTPPALNTTQYWSVQSFPVNSGNFSVRLTRMGNYLRNLIFIYRATSNGTRTTGDTLMPDPLTLTWDTRPLDSLPIALWQHQIYERYGYAGAVGATVPAAESPRGRDLGVYPYDFCHEFDGRVGNELRDLWLPTLGSTRLEVSGSFGGAGTLTVLTNDVSVAGSVFL